MTYALTSLFVITLTLAGTAVVVARVTRNLRDLTIPLTSDF